MPIRYSSRMTAKNCFRNICSFVKGGGGYHGLPLNISREVTQSSPEMLRIKSVITSKILSFLESWAMSDKEKYAVFYKNFGPLLKVGINSDFENKDKIIGLLRFESSLRPKGSWCLLRNTSRECFPIKRRFIIFPVRTGKFWKETLIWNILTSIR